MAAKDNVLRVLDGLEPLCPWTPEWYFCHAGTNMYFWHTMHHVMWDNEANSDMDWFILPKWIDFL